MPIGVVYLTTRDDRSPDLGVSFLDFTDWQAGARSFDATGGVHDRTGRRVRRRPRAVHLHRNVRLCHGVRPRRHAADARPRLHAERRRRLVRPRSSSSGADAWESRYGRDPGSARALDRGQRRAGRHRRRHAGALRFPLERSDLAAALAGPRAPTSRRATRARLSVIGRVRRRHRRVTTPGPKSKRSPGSSPPITPPRTSRSARGWCRSTSSISGATRTRLDRVHGGRHPRRPHLVRECGQPDARPLAEPIPRNCGSHGAWREPPAHHPTTLHRGRDARRARRHRRSGRWRLPACDCSAPAFPRESFPTGSSTSSTRACSRRSSRCRSRRCFCSHSFRPFKAPSPT